MQGRGSMFSGQGSVIRDCSNRNSLPQKDAYASPFVAQETPVEFGWVTPAALHDYLSGKNSKLQFAASSRHDAKLLAAAAREGLATPGVGAAAGGATPAPIARQLRQLRAGSDLLDLDRANQTCSGSTSRSSLARCSSSQAMPCTHTRCRCASSAAQE